MNERITSARFVFESGRGIEIAIVASLDDDRAPPRVTVTDGTNAIGYAVSLAPLTLAEWDELRVEVQRVWKYMRRLCACGHPAGAHVGASPHPCLHPGQGHTLTFDEHARPVVRPDGTLCDCRSFTEATSCAHPRQQREATKALNRERCRACGKSGTSDELNRDGATGSL